MLASRDSTAFLFKVDNGANIGFIASETRSFCHSCSRMRLSATGTLRACLMSEQGQSIRGLPFDTTAAVAHQVMMMKPTGRIESLEQPMYQIGG